MAMINPLTSAGIFGEVHRSLPIPTVENSPAPIRLSRYGSQLTENVVMTKYVLVDEGSYFIATNPTIGTGIAYGSAGTQTSFSATVPFLLFKNNDTSGSPTAKRMFLDYIKLIQAGGTAPATTTAVHAAFVIDTGRAITSAASTFAVNSPVNANGDLSNLPVTQLWVPAGAVATIPAATTSVRQVGRTLLKGGPTLLLDEYGIACGAVDTPSQGGYLTTVSSYWTRMPPIALGAQEFLVMYLWFPGGATNPFTFELECGFWER